MLNINNLERQHKEIWEVFFSIEEVINSKDLSENIDTLVMNINILAGKLNVHMNAEDKFLYPELIKGDNKKLKNMASEYSDEMGDISKNFNEFKNKFNTRNKIINDIEGFLIEGKETLKTLHNRLTKEDRYLYPEVKTLY